MDGFDQDDSEDEGEERGEVDGCFLAAQRDALEALDLADGDFNARPPGVEDFRKEPRPVFDVRAVGDGGTDAAVAGGSAVGLRVVAFVGERGAGVEIRSDVQQDWEMRAVAGLAARQQESDRQALEVCFQMDFRGKAAARPPEGLILLPLLLPPLRRARERRSSRTFGRDARFR